MNWAQVFDEEERARIPPSPPASPSPSEEARRIDEYQDRQAFEAYLDELFYEKYGYPDVDTVYSTERRSPWYAPHENNPAFDAMCAELEFEELVAWAIAFEEEEERRRKGIRAGKQRA